MVVLTVYKSNVNLVESVGGPDLNLPQDADPHLPHHTNDDEDDLISVEFPLLRPLGM